MTEKKKNPEQKNQKPQAKEPDSLKPLKFIGYVRAFTAPGTDTDLEEFVNFAKFTLCRDTKTLWKDPVWDNYTNEEILIEYFANLFTKDDEIRREFETEIDASMKDNEDIYDWLDAKVEENQEELKKRLEEMEDSVSFSPDTLGD